MSYTGGHSQIRYYSQKRGKALSSQGHGRHFDVVPVVPVCSGQKAKPLVVKGEGLKGTPPITAPKYGTFTPYVIIGG